MSTQVTMKINFWKMMAKYLPPNSCRASSTSFDLSKWSGIRFDLLTFPKKNTNLKSSEPYSVFIKILLFDQINATLRYRLQSHQISPFSSDSLMSMRRNLVLLASIIIVSITVKCRIEKIFMSIELWTSLMQMFQCTEYTSTDDRCWLCLRFIS